MCRGEGKFCPSRWQTAMAVGVGRLQIMVDRKLFVHGLLSLGDRKKIPTKANCSFKTSWLLLGILTGRNVLLV